MSDAAVETVNQMMQHFSKRVQAIFLPALSAVVVFHNHSVLVEQKPLNEQYEEFIVVS